MGVSKRGAGRWFVVGRVRRGGKIYHKQRTIDGNKEAAKRLHEQLKAELRGERLPDCSLTSPVETFEALLSLYEDKRGPFSRAHTASVNVLRAELGTVPLPYFADRFEEYRRLLRSTKSRRGRMRSSAALNRPVEIARAAFTLGVGLGVVKENPITRWRFPKYKEIPRDVSLTAEDRERIVRTARLNSRTAHIADAVEYALHVPCRKGEIVAMVIGDVDLFSECIRIRNGRTKNDKGTWKPIPPDMISFFKRRVAEAQSPAEPVFGRFLKAEGRFVGLGDFKNAWGTVRRAAGFPGLRIHDTRHVSATELVDNGTPEQVVMAVAGWRTNMLRTYYHRDPRKSLDLVRFSSECEEVVKGRRVAEG